MLQKLKSKFKIERVDAAETFLKENRRYTHRTNYIDDNGVSVRKKEKGAIAASSRGRGRARKGSVAGTH